LTEPIEFKVCIFGKRGVGKSTLLNEFLKDDEKATSIESEDKIGVNFHKREIIVDGNKISLQLWVIIDDGRYKKFHQGYFKGAVGAIFIYDITDKSSIEKFDYWVSEFRKSKKNRELPILLIGNKRDLLTNGQFSKIDVSDFILRQSIPHYIEYSNTLDNNAVNVFTTFCQAILQIKTGKSQILDIFENDLNLIILNYLRVNRELSLAKLSRRTAKSKATMSRYTRRLINLGLIESHVKDPERQSGTIKRKYFTLKKDLRYNIEDIDSDFFKLESKENLEDFYLRKSFNFKTLNLITRSLSQALEGIEVEFNRENQLLLDVYKRLFDKISYNVHLLSENQYEKYKSLLVEFNSKFNDILKDNDGSEKPYLFANMVFPLLELVNYNEILAMLLKRIMKT